MTACLSEYRMLMLMALVALIHNPCSAQAYRPMLGEGAKWGEQFQFETTVSCVRQVVGDSLINGQLYKRLSVNGYPVNQCNLLLREDTAERKVYFHPNDLEDLVLYDFSLPPGGSDTIYDPCEQAPQIVTLDSVSPIAPPYVAVTLDAPRFFYGHSSSSYPFIWLEGVGSVTGLHRSEMFSLSPPDGNWLTCHADSSGTIDYEGINWLFDSCFAIYLYNSIFENRELDLTIGPNPASNRLIVRTQIADPTMRLDVRDEQGRPVYATKMAALRKELDISGFPSGVYFLSLKAAGAQRTVRFVVAR